VFAVGVMAFEQLVGQHPHGRTSLGALLHAIGHAPAPTLQSRTSDIDPRVAGIVDAMLAFAPGDRPSAREAADTLRAVAAATETWL
jgi:hypothetical protein